MRYICVWGVCGSFRTLMPALLLSYCSKEQLERLGFRGMSDDVAVKVSELSSSLLAQLSAGLRPSEATRAKLKSLSRAGSVHMTEALVKNGTLPNAEAQWLSSRSFVARVVHLETQLRLMHEATEELCVEYGHAPPPPVDSAIAGLQGSLSALDDKIVVLDPKAYTSAFEQLVQSSGAALSKLQKNPPSFFRMLKTAVSGAWAIAKEEAERLKELEDNDAAKKGEQREPVAQTKADGAKETDSAGKTAADGSQKPTETLDDFLRRFTREEGSKRGGRGKPPRAGDCVRAVMCCHVLTLRALSLRCVCVAMCVDFTKMLFASALVM